MASRKYICTNAWARNRKGDIVEEFMVFRYPREIRLENFELVKPKKARKPVKLPTPTPPKKSFGGSKES